MLPFADWNRGHDTIDAAEQAWMPLMNWRLLLKDIPGNAMVLLRIRVYKETWLPCNARGCGPAAVLKHLQLG